MKLPVFNEQRRGVYENNPASWMSVCVKPTGRGCQAVASVSRCMGSEMPNSLYYGDNLDILRRKVRGRHH